MAVIALASGTRPVNRARTLADDRLLTAGVTVAALLAWVLLAWMHAGGVDHHVGFAVADDLDLAATPAAASPVALSAAPSETVLAVAGGHVHGAGAVAGYVGFAGLAGMDVTALVLALTAWITMTVAMMLVTVLPMLTVARSLLPRRSHRGIMLILGVATFVTVWLAVGAALIVNSAALQALSRQCSWLAANPDMVAGVVLVAAGAYQFSRLKDGCLRACRQPHRFAVAHWRGVRPAPVEVMAMTGAYAASCVGCSWALMMACLAVGPAASFPVMIGVCAVMVAERLSSWGRLLTRPVGAVAIVAGLLVGLGVVPLV